MNRYRAIIDDWDAFLDSLSRPQPATLRVNRLKADPEVLRRRLEALGFRLEPYPWYPLLWRVQREPHPPGQTLEHWLGCFYLQEAAAAVPVLALEPQPGERILDLSAAPGGKTAQMAEHMGDRGLVVANDADGRRLGALHHNVSRLGITCVAVTMADGRRFPGGVAFDRVLVDAPCSAEGNARRSARARRGATPHQIRRLAAIQTALLRRGLSLVRPGGVVVYSTCTFAPEENEAVVDAVVRAAGGAVVVEPLPPGLPGVPGVTSWEGHRLLPDLELCRRIYPHHLDSGGMFVARLRRVGPLPWDFREGPMAAGSGSRDVAPGTGEWQAAGPQPGPTPGRSPSPVESPPGPVAWEEADPDLMARVTRWLEDRYGVDPETLAGLHAFALRSGRGIWLAGVPRVPAWPQLRSVGIRAVRDHGATWKPTTFGLIRFAASARRNVVDLGREQLQALLEGRRVAWPPEVAGVPVRGRPSPEPPAASGEAATMTPAPSGPAAVTAPCEPGWVVLRYHGRVLGCGFLQDGRLMSALPQERAQELLSCLRHEAENPADRDRAVEEPRSDGQPVETGATGVGREQQGPAGASRPAGPGRPPAGTRPLGGGGFKPLDGGGS